MIFFSFVPKIMINLEAVWMKGICMKKKKYILLLILLSIIISYLSLQSAVYISYAIDGILFNHAEKIPSYLEQVLEMSTIEGLVIISSIIIIMNLLIVFVNYIRERVTSNFMLKISSNLKKKLYAHILKLEYESYQSYSKVEMLQRVNEDATAYADFFKTQFNLILDIVSLGFFIVSKGVFLSSFITMYLMLTIALMLAFALWYFLKMTDRLKKVINKKKKMLGKMIENMNHFKFVRIYNRQKEEIQKYKRLNREYTQEDVKFVDLILFYEIVSEHMTYVKDPIIYLLGGIAIMRGSMTLGTLATFILLASKILGCLYTFGENLEVLDTFLVVKQKIKKLMNLKEEENGNNYYDLDGDIVFNHVSINISQREILSDLNFEIKKGEKIAILGENGSGKSVLAKAILGFYPLQGAIYLNHHNNQQLNPSNIRQYIDFVSGEADLFTGTILENIQLNKEATEQQLIKVVKEAKIYQDIKRFEEGCQTLVGEKGVKLSGGQKQRIIMARALLRNKPIMIFDNSFSKLDNKTSDKVFHNLIKKYPQTTMIFITHKAEIENYVDRVIKISGIKSNNEEEE